MTNLSTPYHAMLANGPVDESHAGPAGVLEQIGIVAYRYFCADEKVEYFGAVDVIFGGFDDSHQDIRTLTAFVHPDDKDYVAHAVSKSSEARLPLCCRYRIIRRDGSILFCENRGSVTEADGTCKVSIVGIIQIITDNEEPIDEAVTRAHQRRNSFLSFLAHEIKNPLAALDSGIRRLQRRAISEEAHGSLDMLSRQVANLHSLFDDILQVSKSKLEAGMLTKSSIDCVDLVDQAFKEIQPFFEKRVQQFHFRRPDEMLELHADSNRLEQALRCLLENAVKYSLNPGTVTVSLASSRDSVTFRIDDEGVGMAPATLDSLFCPYAELLNREKRSGDGLGFGLLLVKQIVAAHGGRIWATSKGLGQGSSFYLAVPRL